MSIITKLARFLLGAGGSERNGPSMDGMLEQMDRELKNFQTLIRPSASSKPRTPFDTDLSAAEMSLTSFSTRQILQVLPKMIPLMINMRRSARMYDGTSRPRQSRATPEFIEQLEELAYEAGVKDIRYIKVPPYAIFKEKGIPHQYAIIYTVEMDKEPIDTSPSFASQLEVMDGYKQLAKIGNKLARFMHRAGFAAYPGTALGGLTDYVHLGELAGLGAIGYHGLLITPDEGARLRINTIYTNIENLPIQEENEHLWVRDFCAMCKKCVRKCPVSAIYQQPQPRGDGGMQCIDHDTCRDYFAKNYGCAVCLAVCPFSQVGYDKVRQRFKGNPNAPRFTIPVNGINTIEAQDG